MMNKKNVNIDDEYTQYGGLEQVQVPICKVISLAFCVICGMFVGINLGVSNTYMAAMNGGISVIMLISYILLRLTNNAKYSIHLLAVVLLAMTLSYLKTGGQDGFSLLWVLLIPPFAIFIMGYKQAMGYCVLLMFILMGAFWTPLREYCYPFTQTFQIRFPILYIAEVLVALLTKYQLYRTEQKRDELLQQNIKYKLEAEAANRAKSDFLASMSHEIRTPINAVLGMNEMISRESTEKEIQSYSENIHRAGNTLLMIINDILDFSKIESGKMQINLIEYSLSSVLGDMVQIIKQKAEEKGLELKLNIDPNLYDQLYGDDVRIKQIVLNLLTNAVKYTETGSVTLIAKAEDREDDRMMLYIGVKDTGIGIRQEDIDHLCDTFQRVDETKNRAIEGTGLGLAITKKFIDMMHGTFQIHSTYGEGSLFEVRVPQIVKSTKEIGDFESRYKQSFETHSSYHQLFTAPKAKLLIVDDNEMNRMVIRGLLKKTQIQIDEAEDGLTCINKLEHERYNLVLLDHMMPKMDGIETIKELNKKNLINNIPVIALTANAMSGAKEYYIQEGFKDYISKPIEGEKLEKKIVQWIDPSLINKSDGLILQQQEQQYEQQSIQVEYTEKKENIKNFKATPIKTEQLTDNNTSDREKHTYKKETIKMGNMIKFCVFLCGIVILLVLTTFNIEDQTWANKEVTAYNDGWYIVSGYEKKEVTLPISESVPANEMFSIERVLNSSDCGKTMRFLSADVFLSVYVDDQQIYEFGYKDERWFGHTPGSIINFVDIPDNMEGKTLRIEYISPYKNYAGDIKTFTIGDRDKCILDYLCKNTVNILVCVFIFIGAIFLYALFLILKFSKQATHSIEYLSLFAFVCGIYYLIETKVLTLFYGNQTLYSVLIFLLLILMPVSLSQYYKNTLFVHIGKALNILQKCIIFNCIVQIILQLSNVADFMEMAFVSHIIIGINLALIMYGFAKVQKTLRNNEYHYEVVGIICFWIGSALDLIRTVIGQTGDLGKYSRVGAMIFLMVMIIVHIRYMIIDYTKSLKETADQLLIEKNAAEMADKAKSTFLANMSHEIRTPINAVLGMDEMILRESEEGNVLDYATDIQRAGKSLLALVNEILDFSKIETGNIELINVEYQLSSVINDVVTMVTDRIKEKNLQFNIQIDKDLPSILFGDEVRIRQIILNILNNAVKYTDKGCVSLMIDYDNLESKDNELIQLRVRVSDTGRGIKTKDLEQLFQSFKRLDNKTNCTVEGVGLGLSIVERFVNLMDGHVDVESVYGEGSVFTVLLPQRVVSRDSIGKFKENIDEHSNMWNDNNQSFTAPEVKILVVDDNEMNLKVVTGLLSKNKIQIDTSLNGMKAIELVSQNKYNLILMDHMMPKMDGVETLKELKERNLISNTPVIALTANAVSGAREQYLSYGFQDYLSKPVSGDQLARIMQKWIPKELIRFNELENKSIESQEQSIQKEKSEVQLETDEFLGIEQIQELNMEKAMSFSGDGKKGVIWNIELYLQQINPSLDKLNMYLENEQKEDYTIAVHALKSNLALIGAETLSEAAKNLEMAGKNEEWDYILNNHQALIDKLNNLNAKLCKAVGQDYVECSSHEAQQSTESQGTDEIQYNSHDKLNQILENLITAAQNFDAVSMDEIKSQLQELDGKDGQTELSQIIQAIENYDFDSVIELVEKVRGKL